MVIEIEVDDLTTFAKAVNNATAVYGDIVSAIRFGCDPCVRHKVKEALEKIPEEELQRRFECLTDVYAQLVDKERELNDAWRKTFKK